MSKQYLGFVIENKRNSIQKMLDFATPEIIKSLYASKIKMETEKSTFRKLMLDKNSLLISPSKEVFSTPERTKKEMIEIEEGLDQLIEYYLYLTLFRKKQIENIISGDIEGYLKAIQPIKNQILAILSALMVNISEHCLLNKFSTSEHISLFFKIYFISDYFSKNLPADADKKLKPRFVKGKFEAFLLTAFALFGFPPKNIADPNTEKWLCVHLTQMQASIQNMGNIYSSQELKNISEILKILRFTLQTVKIEPHNTKREHITQLTALFSEMQIDCLEEKNSLEKTWLDVVVFDLTVERLVFDLYTLLIFADEKSEAAHLIWKGLCNNQTKEEIFKQVDNFTQNQNEDTPLINYLNENLFINIAIENNKTKTNLYSLNRNMWYAAKAMAQERNINLDNPAELIFLPDIYPVISYYLNLAGIFKFISSYDQYALDTEEDEELSSTACSNISTKIADQDNSSASKQEPFGEKENNVLTFTLTNDETVSGKKAEEKAQSKLSVEEKKKLKFQKEIYKRLRHINRVMATLSQKSSNQKNTSIMINDLKYEKIHNANTHKELYAGVFPEVVQWISLNLKNKGQDKMEHPKITRPKGGQGVKKIIADEKKGKPYLENYTYKMKFLGNGDEIRILGKFVEDPSHPDKLFVLFDLIVDHDLKPIKIKHAEISIKNTLGSTMLEEKRRKNSAYKTSSAKTEVDNPNQFSSSNFSVQNM